MANDLSFKVNPTLLGSASSVAGKWDALWGQAAPDVGATPTGNETASPRPESSEAPRGDDIQLAADNQRQNKMVRDIVVQLQLSPGQAQALHREISGGDLKYQEVLERAKEMFGK